MYQAKSSETVTKNRNIKEIWFDIPIDEFSSHEATVGRGVEFMENMKHLSGKKIHLRPGIINIDAEHKMTVEVEGKSIPADQIHPKDGRWMNIVRRGRTANGVLIDYNTL